uniref:Uncharacterized protein n=1 Tax=Rhizophora mucronata TaxID=61149 RepID=A0A2P2NZU4_RHIMU
MKTSVFRKTGYLEFLIMMILKAIFLFNKQQCLFFNSHPHSNSY